MPEGPKSRLVEALETVSLRVKGRGTQILCIVQENYISLVINKKRKFKFLSRVDKAPQNLA